MSMALPGVQTAEQIDLVLWKGEPGPMRPRPGRPGEILTALARAKRNAALYSAGHPVVDETINDTHQAISQHVQARSSLILAIHEDTFFAENVLLLEESLRLSSLLVELKEREVGSIEFVDGLEPWELTRLIEVLNLSVADLGGQGGAATRLSQARVQHVAIRPPRMLSPEDRARIRVDPRDAYRAGLRAMDEVSFEASRDLPLELHKAKLVLKSIVDLIQMDRTSMMSVAALKTYDEDTFHHSVNVSILSMMMAARLQLDRVLTVALGLAAMLHDIGKVRVPPAIITKPGVLTPGELEVVRRHPIYGAYLLGSLSGLARLAMVVALEHHANYDLSGYPRLSVKKVPHLLSRIVQLADFYDAATSSRRLYRRPMLPSEAIRLINHQAGKLFDSTLARLFVQVLGLYPSGSVVELDMGELAVVIRPSERDVCRPLVKVVTDAARDLIEPWLLNLEEYRERRIARAVDPVEVGVNVAAYL